MTEEEFYAELEALAHIGWRAELRRPGLRGFYIGSCKFQDPDNLIRLTRPSYLVGGSEEENFCPITAVCAAIRGRFFVFNEYMYASRILGLSDSFAGDVADAADCKPGYNTGIRSRLLQALDLSD
jgi:hypothetical protein